MIERQVVDILGCPVNLDVEEGEQVTTAVVIINTQSLNEDGKVIHTLQWSANEGDDSTLEGLVSRVYRDVKRVVDDRGERS